jgi:NAD(P)-dependent dehydrogenase (short-subunit alcohol dehydrogenase family)
LSEGIDPLAAFRLDGRVALITGASSGLGARFAAVLAGTGARVVLVARRADKLAEVAAGIPGAVTVVADVSRPGDVDRVASVALDTCGRVDVLVNNAGIGDVIRAEDEPLDQFKEVLDVNLVGAFHLSQVIGRHMLERGSGSVINVASVLSFVSAGSIPQAGYAASKGGLVNLTRELAAQWGRQGVRVNSLCPGWFKTEMTGDMFADEKGLAWVRRKTVLGRLGGEEELDGALVWLASDASSYVTGQAIVVDGGYLAI